MTLDDVRTELVRSRGFIRGAETQLTKALDALGAVMGEEPEEPEPEPEPTPTGAWPNMPDGWTVLSTNNWTDWDSTTSPENADGQGAWIAAEDLDGGFIVDDATVPLGAGKAVRHQIPANSESSWTGPAFEKPIAGTSKLYIGYYFRFGEDGGSYQFETQKQMDIQFGVQAKLRNGPWGFCDGTYLMFAEDADFNCYTENQGQQAKTLAQMAGQYVLIEQVMDIDADTLKVWLDDVLLMSYSGINWPSTTMSSSPHFDGFWGGGNSGTNPAQNVYWGPVKVAAP